MDRASCDLDKAVALEFGKSATDKSATGGRLGGQLFMRRADRIATACKTYQNPRQSRVEPGQGHVFDQTFKIVEPGGYRGQDAIAKGLVFGHTAAELTRGHYASPKGLFHDTLCRIVAPIHQTAEGL